MGGFGQWGVWGQLALGVDVFVMLFALPFPSTFFRRLFLVGPFLWSGRL